MAEIGVSEAGRRLGALLDRVERGEEIVIVRKGKPVARLVADRGTNPDAVRRVIAEMRELAGRLSLRGLKIRDLIEEGRP